MNQFLIAISIVVFIVSGGYIFGRFFAKGFFKELDLILGKKFVDYMNNKQKQKENGNKKEEV